MARSKGNVVQMPPPFTAVETQRTSTAAVEEAIVQTMMQNAALLQKYHQLWYESAAHTWGFTSFLGVGMMKCPNDLWAYQDILTQLRPLTVLECGTFTGGSALWFASLMDLLGIYGEVLTVDIEPAHRDPRVQHPRLTFYGGSSTDPTLAREILDRVQHPLLVVLDSDHAAAHVRAELELYAPACHVGDRLVVEDTNVAWLHDRGARGALEDYLIAHPKEWRQDILPERYLLSMHPGGWLERVAP